jgi:hypothetical protein
MSGSRNMESGAGSSDGGGPGGGGTSAAAASRYDGDAKAVSQLVQTADDALERLRYARALELRERALARADEALPPTSLLVAWLLHDVCYARTAHCKEVLAATGTSQHAVEYVQAWRTDEHILLPLAQRCLAIMLARWRAGTLLVLEPHERTFFVGTGACAQLVIAGQYTSCAVDAVRVWPLTLPTAAEEDARAHAVYGALRTALELDARGFLPSGGLTEAEEATTLGADVARTARILLAAVLSGSAGWMLQRLRATCGLSQPEEEDLRRLMQRTDFVQSQDDAFIQHRVGDVAAKHARAAADVERHGLRRCALPACGATEAHPKLFKLCGRCRGAAYCCAAHSAEDWKRHKREDACRAAAP